ncbi:MAG: SpoIIE family protein phosphatase [Chthoniobacteraceae bacterium]
MPGPAKSLKHELRTPLNHIIGYCEMLIEEAQDDGREKVIPDLERIHAAGRGLLGVINDLFDPEKAPAFWKYPSLLDHEVRTPLNQIIGYAELLQEDTAAGEGSTYLADLGKIHAAARGLLEMVVQNFGSEWTEPPGLDSAAPSSDGPAVPRTPTLSGGAASGRVGRILVVDDDAPNREMLRRRLERLGHLVQLAENGRRALELLTREPFDLMLLDLQMPEMNGYQVLERVKEDEALREIPIIVLSASDETSRVAQCIEMGAADYLPKPFDPVLLRARIDACLEKKKLRDRERAAHEALERSQKHLAAELAKAANYVRSLLPAPMRDCVHSEWCFEPSEALGGDAFGHYWLDDDHFAIYLLDVCGHGVGAALLSVSVLNTLRARALPGTNFQDPASVLAALNLAYPAEAQNFFYFTIWYGVYRASTRELSYASGGHPPSLLLAGGQVTPLVTDCPPIGCFDNSRFVGGHCTVAPDARLLVFSDGVFEIFLERERVQTLEEFVASFANPDVLAMRPHERHQHAQWLRGAENLEDDFSLLELRFP